MAETGFAAIRLATLDDAEAIARLIELSVRGLQADDYTAEQMTGALGTVFGVDRQLIRDGSYFVAERDDQMVGCGGWSWRQTLFGGDAVAGKNDDELRPGVDAARIRAFFVHPDFARRGIGSQIMRACEEAARAHGFTDLTLMATLTGVRLYLRHGFEAVERHASPLGNGAELPMVEMYKRLAGVQLL
jgi:GNAT superfamily N-acetyltransferase